MQTTRMKSGPQVVTEGHRDLSWAMGKLGTTEMDFHMEKKNNQNEIP